MPGRRGVAEAIRFRESGDRTRAGRPRPAQVLWRGARFAKGKPADKRAGPARPRTRLTRRGDDRPIPLPAILPADPARRGSGALASPPESSPRGFANSRCAAPRAARHPCRPGPRGPGHLASGRPTAGSGPCRCRGPAGGRCRWHGRCRSRCRGRCYRPGPCRCGPASCNQRTAFFACQKQVLAGRANESQSRRRHPFASRKAGARETSARRRRYPCSTVRCGWVPPARNFTQIPHRNRCGRQGNARGGCYPD